MSKSHEGKMKHKAKRSNTPLLSLKTFNLEDLGMKVEPVDPKSKLDKNGKSKEDESA